MPNRYFLDPHFTLSLTVTLLVALTSPVMTWQEACPNAPWSLTFSYGRALQSATLKVRTALLHHHSPLQLDIPLHGHLVDNVESCVGQSPWERLIYCRAQCIVCQ